MYYSIYNVNMCWSAKACIIAWWISAIIALLLWYRDQTYDRVIAVILFVLGLIQLVNYGCHSAVEPTVSGKAIIILLAVLLAVITISTFLYTGSYVAMALGIIAIIYLVFITITAVMGQCGYLAFVDDIGKCPTWTRDGGPILGWWIWPYFIIILMCWVVVMAYQGFNDIALYVLGIFILASGIWLVRGTNRLNLGARWTYFLVGLGLLVWLSGIIADFLSRD